MTELPAWATEQVSLHPADPTWSARGEELALLLTTLLGPWLADEGDGAVMHIGSTSVPGLDAKPILDLQAAVRDLAEVPAAAQVLAPYGWHLVPAELDGRAYERFLILAEGDHRVAHLHLLRPGDRHARDRLAFRDALRRDPALAGEYAALKARLAAEHGDHREAYTDAKSGIISSVLGRA